jgi:hypothetical protein
MTWQLPPSCRQQACGAVQLVFAQVEPAIPGAPPNATHCEGGRSAHPPEGKQQATDWACA